jgi:hypothetical protein
MSVRKPHYAWQAALQLFFTALLCASSRLLGAAQTEVGPEGESEDEGELYSIGRERARRFAGEEAARGVEDGGVKGFRRAMVSIQPWSKFSGTKTCARKRTMKMGVRITGPACWVRISIATPAPKSEAWMRGKAKAKSM